MSAEARLEELGITLPPPPPPGGVYKPLVVYGNLAYLSGHGPLQADGTYMTGRRVIKSLGFVNSTDDFAEQPLVINGYSELYRDIFGDENGVGARSAIGTSILPGNIPVEIEVIFEIGV